MHWRRKWDNVLAQKFVVSAQKQVHLPSSIFSDGSCLFITHAGMYALRERRQHVTQEDFEFAVAKVSRFSQDFCGRN